MHIVVEDDDSHHDPETEGGGLFTGKPAAILPMGTQTKMENFKGHTDNTSEVLTLHCKHARYENVGEWKERADNLRGLQHDFADTRHRAKAICRVLNRQVLVLFRPKAENTTDEQFLSSK